MNQHGEVSGEMLGQALKTLEPTPPVSERQWQRNRELLRTRREARRRLGSVQLAACIAGLVILLIAATFLIARPGHRSDGPAVPLPDGGQQINPSCLSVPTSGRVAAAASTSTDTVELQFASHDTFPELCAYSNGRIGLVTPQSDPSSTTGLLQFGTDSVWLIALPPTGTASIRVETPAGSSSTGSEGGKDFQKIDRMTVVALPIAGRPAWVRTTFLDSGGKVLRLSKTQLGGTATAIALQKAAQSQEAALSSNTTATESPSSAGLPADSDITSCAPHDPTSASAAAGPPEYWIALSCNGTPATASLAFGHGGTAAAFTAMSETLPDSHAVFPHLSQVGSQTDVLIGAFTPVTATATITLTNGGKVTFGTAANPWRTLRAGWHGMIYLGQAAARAERVATFDSSGRLLATQELYY